MESEAKPKAPNAKVQIPPLSDGKFIQSFESQIGRTTYFEVGPTSGQAVILCPGYLCSSMIFSKYAAQLAEKGFRAISYDPFGTGGSIKTSSDPYSLELFESQLSSLIDFIGLQNVILIGHSLGGAICSQYTAKHQQNVAKLILISPPALNINQGPASIVKIIQTPAIGEMFFRYFYPFIILSAIQANFVNPNSPKMASIVQFLYLQIYSSWYLNPTFPKAACELMRRMGSAEFASKYCALSVPTLVILGKDDTTIPYSPNFEFWSKVGGQITIKTIEEAGHWLFHEKSEEFYERTVEFIGGENHK